MFSSVGHQRSGLSEFAKLEHRRHAVNHGPPSELIALDEEHRVWEDEECADALTGHRGESAVKIARTTDLEHPQVKPEGLSGGPRCLQMERMHWIVRIPEDGDTDHLGRTVFSSSNRFAHRSEVMVVTPVTLLLGRPRL